MVLNKTSIIIVGVFTGLLIMALGLVSFGLDYTNWLVPVTALLGGLILWIEVGIKKVTNISTLKNLGSMQYISLTIGALSVLNGVLTMPVLDIQVEFLNKIAGFVAVLVGLFIIIEIFSKD